MLSLFCERLLLEMGNIFHEISKKPLYICTEVGGWIGGFTQNHTCAYRVGELVKNVVIL